MRRPCGNVTKESRGTVKWYMWETLCCYDQAPGRNPSHMLPRYQRCGRTPKQVKKDQEKGGDYDAIQWCMCIDGWPEEHMAKIVYLCVCVCLNVIPQESWWWVFSGTTDLSTHREAEIPAHTVRWGRDLKPRCFSCNRSVLLLFVQTNSNSTDLCVCETREGTINIHQIKTLYLIYSISEGLRNQYPLKRKMTSWSVCVLCVRIDEVKIYKV